MSDALVGQKFIDKVWASCKMPSSNTDKAGLRCDLRGMKKILSMIERRTVVYFPAIKGLL